MTLVALVLSLLVARRTPSHRPVVFMLAALVGLHAASLLAGELELPARAQSAPLLLVPAVSALGVSVTFGQPAAGALGGAAAAALAVLAGTGGWASVLLAAVVAQAYAWGAWAGGGRAYGPAQEVARVSAATDALALGLGLLVGWDRLAPWARVGAGAVVVVQAAWLWRTRGTA